MAKRHKYIERKRLVVVRGIPAWSPYGAIALPPDREVVVADGVRRVQVPTIDPRGGFGAIVFEWDGKETTVSGLPVYR